MITLALQIFLLLLSAFLAGCLLGCMLRRMFHDSRADQPVENMATTAVATASPAPVLRPTTPEAARFERALTGREASATSNARSEPVVEVRQRTPDPAPPPPAAPVAPQQVTQRPETVRPAALAPATIEIVKAAPTPAPEPAPVAAPEIVTPPDRANVVSSSAPAYQPSTDPAPVPLAPAGYTLDLPLDPAPAPPAPAAAPPAPPAKDPAAVRDDSASAAASYTAIAAASAAAAGIAAASKPSAPEPTPAPPTFAAKPSPPADDLKRIRGIDTALESRLNAVGVHRYADVAGWTTDDVARMSQSLGLVGRIEQENWIEQSQILARGGETDYSRRQRIASSTAAASAASTGAAAASAAASATAQASAGPDRLTRIIGIDAELEKALIGMGVTRYADISRWSSSDIEKVEGTLGLPGRVGLDNWVEQARVLARYAGETETPASRPVRLADAIRENKDTAAKAAAAPQSPRGELAGLRSVRSEALRSEPPLAGDRTDDLKRIRGVGVLIEKRLNSLGIVSYEQIANWTGADIDRISTMLDFKGRIERENWIEQARILASGGQTEFSRRVDRGEVDSSRES